MNETNQITTYATTYPHIGNRLHDLQGDDSWRLNDTDTKLPISYLSYVIRVITPWCKYIEL